MREGEIREEEMREREREREGGGRYYNGQVSKYFKMSSGKKG